MSEFDPPEQCVILVGGLGTRLGSLTAHVPKPLLLVAGAPFLDELLWHVGRFGFRKVLLLAGHRGEKVVEYAASRPPDPRLSIEVVVESEPLGTAGAIAHAAPLLEERFFLLNGDSLFDFNWLDLVALYAEQPACRMAMALRREEDASRFGVVEMTAERVTGFRERGDQKGGLVNGGVYLMAKELVRTLPPRGSLEADVLPQLAERSCAYGRVQQGFFLDIGMPASYAAAAALIAQNRRRPALFLDRDGVLNVDHGYVHKVEDFEWTPGAIQAVKQANDHNYFVFLVTNQAGVARGYYSEAQLGLLHEHLQRELRRHGAHIDDFRYCPFHPEGTVAKYAKASPWRKPEPGMFLDLLEHWPVDRGRSIVVGDKLSDLEAASRAGLSGFLFDGGNLAKRVAELI